MAANNRKSIKRFKLILFGVSLAGLYILGTALSTMLLHADYWEKVSMRFVSDSISVEAGRGSIISADGKVMVASLPQYRLFMDYVVIDKDSSARQEAQLWRDSMVLVKADSIAMGLHDIFPDKSVEWFKKHFLEGKKRRSHAWNLYPSGLATYIQYKQVKELPLLRETPLKGGFNPERIMLRKKPYGSLASRTLGNLSKDSAKAVSGLEWCYDTILSGQNGIKHRSKVRNQMINFYDQQPVNGHDLVTTIDATMQDIAEKAIRNKLKEINGDKGVVILMEVATGDIKAIVSLTRDKDDGEYYEVQNDAINALWEPGSTFKTGSIMVALEDGKITPNTRVETGNGVYMMHGRPMIDHNWRKGGYGNINVTEVLEHSSNIGVSRLIDDAYHDHPEKYVQGLYNLGVGIPLGLPMGANPRVRMPNTDKTKGNWSKTALAWMSIGYETQIPPISTVTFYNAIANNGRMVRPRFVKAEMANGQVVREFPVEVIKEQICSPHTLRDIRTILEKVVSEGLGRKAGNKRFKVSGKTGTAQVAENGSYASHAYMVSFCGYFPSDNPKYSCIVCIRKRGLPASGGVQCGPVFSEISQLVMNQGVCRDPREAADSTSIFTPFVANGNTKDARKLLSMMDIPWQGVLKDESTLAQSPNTVPNVKGMGARDAIYLLQSAGLKVKLHGTGIVVGQSIPAGTKNAKGRTISINLK
ncbi:MAG: transpeptidase family protein [Bacteroidaceae bacterium]|nr:transpeptidase family protein [Bacteroidaceae bacterium]